MEENEKNTSAENDLEASDNPSKEPIPNTKAEESSTISSEELSGEYSFRIVSESSFNSAQADPVKHPEKKRKSVPLLAFVASLLAVVLVCSMFAVAIASATHRLGYLKGVEQMGGLGIGDDTPVGLEDFSELEFLDRFFKANSYNDLSEADFLSAVLKAYVAASGDLYAEYYTAEEYEALMSDRSGESVGIGVSVIYSTVTVDGSEYTAMEIVTAFPNSPASEAGVMPGDLVFYLGVGDQKELVQSIGYTEALNRMRGEKGSVAEFTVLRPKSDGKFEQLEFRITRDEYTMQSVEYKVSETDPTVGVVRILQFDLTTPKQFEKAMDALIEKGIKRFIFDVRNNPGGDLKSICAVLSFFLEKGDLIISTVDRNGSKEETFVKAVTYSGDYAGCSIKNSDIGKYRDYDMAVLTNQNTASAAELFTAALRDYKLATTVGVTTYGKGSMQTMYSLAYFGYEGAIKLTTRHYFPPCGEGYDGIGIKPDVYVELSEEAAATNIYKLAEADDDQLQKALSELRGSN